MKDRRDEKIRQLERRLLKANRVGAEELREIVAAPQLLEKINARIKLALETEEEAARLKASVWSFPKIGFAFGAVAAIVLALAVGFVFFPAADFSARQLTEKVVAPAIDEPTEFNGQPDIEESGENEIAAVRKTGFKSKRWKSERRARVVNSTRRARPANPEPEEAFYPLAFAENIEEAKESGQVIRVELSRSSLLALGVKPPSDDENLRVKTDLLIGTDGVARGIRFVR